MCPPNDHHETHQCDHHHEVAVAVLTPDGIYPDAEDFHRTPITEPVHTVLKLAADHLGLKNTVDWIALVCDREIDINRSYTELGLQGIVEIEWHKREGGGGYA